MFCTKCGSQISEGTAFCPTCGTQVANAQPAQAQQPVVGAQQPMQQPVQQPVVGAQQPVQNMQQPVQQYQQAPAPVGAVPMNQTSVRGCFGSGWDDVKNSPGWFKKVALMGLIGLVPILNWTNDGYGWNWAKDLTLGKKEHLPSGIVNGENFKLGAYIFVISLVAAFALGFEGCILGIIPVLGLLAAIALGVFADMFINLSYIRTAMFGNLGAGFEVGKLFEGYKRNLGTLFCISAVPGLVAAGIGCVIVFVFVLLAGAIAGTDLLALASASSRYGYMGYGRVPNSLMYASAGAIGVVFLLGIVAAYLELVAYRFCELVAARATAYYVVRNVPEWAPFAAASRQEMANAAAVAAAPTNPTQYQQAAPVMPVSPVQPVQPAQPAQPVLQPQQPVQSVGDVVANVAPAVAAAAATPAVVAQPEPASEPLDQYDPYAFDETSVLPELPDEDLDTVVQPELKTVSEEPVVQAAADTQPAAPAEDGAVRLQPTVASGPLMGDDSDTMVLMGDSPSDATQAQSTTTLHSVQLTRANGDTCVLSTFPVTIGKGSEADLVIDGNGAISRIHVRILRDGDVFAAEDMGSTNKTFIGSYELPPHTPTILSDGDVLKLANETLQVKFV